MGKHEVNQLKELKNKLIKWKQLEEVAVDKTKEDEYPCIYNYHMGKFGAYGEAIALINEMIKDN